jgi:MFS family permease
LRQRDFRLLWIGDTISSVGSNVTQVALPLVAVLTLRVSTFELGLLGATLWLPWLLISLPVGAWVDRLPRRPVLVACDLGSLLLFVSVPVAAWFDVLSLAQLMAVALLTGMAEVFANTAYRVFLAGLITPAQLAGANALTQGSVSAARVAGRGAGGLIAQWFGPVFGLLVDAVSFAVSAICLLLIRTREPEIPPRPPTSRLRHEIGSGLRFVFGDPYLRAIVLFGGLINLAFMGYGAIQVTFLLHTLDLPPAAVGVLVAASSAGGVLGALVAGRLGRRFGTARGLLISVLGTVPFDLLIPLARPGPLVALQAVGMFVTGSGVVAANVFIGSFSQSYPPPELRGRVSATSSMIIFGAVPVGSLLAGGLGSAFGVRPAIWVLMSLVVASSLFLVGSPIRRRRDLPEAATAQPVSAT